MENSRSLGWISDTVAGVIENRPRLVEGDFWNQPDCIAWPTIGLVYLISTGVGVWGLNHPVAWGWAIVNLFGGSQAHAGTLISAILFLLRQKWRTSINRASEAMTIFAVMCAGIFPAVRGPYLV